VSYARRRAWDRKHPTALSDSQFAAALTAGGAADPRNRPLDLRPFQLGPITPVPGASAGYRLVAAASSRHVFDLLGSGPVLVNYETVASGAFGGKYEMRPGRDAERVQVARMREALGRTAEYLDEQSPSLERYRAALHADLGTYRPIDWHLDFKSGYRWDRSAWYMDIPVGHAPGVDVKVPWELSRCHHLVALALDGATGGAGERTSDELGLQVLDWVCGNPVRFGVNWRSAMDVAIRAANWLRAIAIAGGERSLPSSVVWMAAKSLYEHGLHVASHMDYEEHGSNNHYLADIAGLLHIAAALPGTPEAPYWTAWSLRELSSEMGRTVTADGASYEGSTGYHRLVAETFLHASTIAVSLPAETRARAATPDRSKNGGLRPARLLESGIDLSRPEVFPDWYWLRLRRMIEFTADITKPNGLVPQLGDQDSGRFLKLAWPMRPSTGAYLEEPRDHSHLVAAGGALLSTEKIPFDDSELRVEMAATRRLASLSLKGDAVEDTGPERRSDGDARSFWHPGGGVCVLTRGNFWLAVHCLAPHPDSPTGHMHDDQLSFELNVAGKDFVIDPGTGVYTGSPGIRNKLRARSSHSTVESGRHVGATRVGVAGRGLFSFGALAPAKRVEMSASTFSAVHSTGKVVHRRTFALEDGALAVEEEVSGQRTHFARIILDPEVRARRGADGLTVHLENSGVRLTLVAGPETERVEVTEGLSSEAYGSVRTTTCLAMERRGNRGSFRVVIN
jgi:hypothetical protein